jgi:hypothetical protein
MSPWWQLQLGQQEQQAEQQVLVLVLVLGLQHAVLVLVLVLVLVPGLEQELQALELSRHRSLWQRLQVSSCCCASTGRQRRFSRPARHCRSSSYQLFVRRQRSQGLQKQATRPLY